MKFRNVRVCPLVITGSTASDLEYQLSKLDKLYDLQYSISEVDGIKTFSALALIELDKETKWQRVKRKLKSSLKQLLEKK